MKIALLSTFYPFRGGIAQFNARLFRVLEKDHDVKAFTFTRQYPQLLFPGTTQLVTGDDNADPVPAVRLLDTINPLSFPGTIHSIRAFQPEMLVTRLVMPFFAPSLGFVAAGIRKSGTRVVSILDNVIPHEPRPGDKALTSYFLKRNDAFLAMSRTVENDLRRFVPDAVCKIQPHPLYDHFGEKTDMKRARAKLNLPIDKKILLFFGFIRDYKGLDVLLESMNFLDDSYHLLVGGEVYGSFEKYQHIIEKNRLKNKVTLRIRYIKDTEVADFFSAADVAVLPYRTATQSGITQIAFSFNLPVIVTDVGGLSEMVTH